MRAAFTGLVRMVAALRWIESNLTDLRPLDRFAGLGAEGAEPAKAPSRRRDHVAGATPPQPRDQGQGRGRVNEAEGTPSDGRGEEGGDGGRGVGRGFAAWLQPPCHPKEKGASAGQQPPHVPDYRPFFFWGGRKRTNRGGLNRFGSDNLPPDRRRGGEGWLEPHSLESTSPCRPVSLSRSISPPSCWASRLASATEPRVVTGGGLWLSEPPCRSFALLGPTQGVDSVGPGGPGRRRRLRPGWGDREVSKEQPLG